MATYVFAEESGFAIGVRDGFAGREVAVSESVKSGSYGEEGWVDSVQVDAIMSILEVFAFGGFPVLSVEDTRPVRYGTVRPGVEGMLTADGSSLPDWLHVVARFETPWEMSSRVLRLDDGI